MPKAMPVARNADRNPNLDKPSAYMSMNPAGPKMNMNAPMQSTGNSIRDKNMKRMRMNCDY